MAPNTDQYRKRIALLPEHDSKQVEQAATQLDMLHASFNTGSLDLPLTRMRKHEVIEQIGRFERMNVKEMREGWMFEPPFDPEDPSGWLEKAKEIRKAYLTEQFELISRLRDDDPEAWDEINELYFDD